MPRISNPTTGTGDDGTTATSNGERVPKDSPNISTLGAIDELNSVIGLTLSHHAISAKVVESLRLVQNDLFHLGAEINALDTPDEITAHPCIEEHHVKHLEDTIAELYKELVPLRNFTLPGGTPAAATLHLARTVCRRAEREAVTLARTAKVRPTALQYLNRLSDALFVMARWENQHTGTSEAIWDSHR